MGANEKHEAAYHGGKYTPGLDEIRRHWGLSVGAHRRDERAEAFDRMIAKVRAEAKWDALMETATALERLDDDVEMYDENMRATPVTVWLRARANQYKEN